ncbi:DUF6624 domain-containing protein [Hyphobacterium sp.]|uniref:DUF6624 domain-containing protein n=1 Tax=Hyphobacterium sp. TaxID=2004662 RepID=UPI00374A35E2
MRILIIWILFISGTAWADNVEDALALLNGIESRQIDPVLADWSPYILAMQNPEVVSSSAELWASFRAPAREAGYQPGDPIPSGVLPCIARGFSAGGILATRNQELADYRPLLEQGRGWMMEQDLRLLQAQEEAVADIAESNIYRELVMRLESDQWWRRVRRQDQPQFVEENPELFQYIWQAVAFRWCEADESNGVYLDAFVEEHGWPALDEAPNAAIDAAWLILQHGSLERQEAFLPMLENEVAEGRAQPRLLARLVDRILLNNDQPQRYGTHWRCQDGEINILEYEDPDHIDDRRISVGLATIAEAYTGPDAPQCPN